MTRIAWGRRARISVVTVLLWATTAAACSSGGSGATEDGTLTWALDVSPKTLFAPTSFSTVTGTVTSLVQEGLLALGTDGKLENRLARSWRAENPLTYVYELREDATFSDGRPVTADDVAFSLGLHRDSRFASQMGFFYANVAAIEAGDNRVVIRLTKPDSSWQFVPATMGGYVYPRKSVEAQVGTFGSSSALPVGSGPYKVTEFVPDSSITLKRNDAHVGRRGTFDTVKFKIIPDPQTRLLAMGKGEIDGSFSVPPQAVDAWRDAATVRTYPALEASALTLDMRNAPLNDVHVRRALYHATDRAGLVAGLKKGQAKVATSLNPPAVFTGVLPGSEVEAAYAATLAYPYDMAKARAELEQSATPGGFSTTLNVPSDVPVLVSLAEALQRSWAQIGVTVQIKAMPGGERFQNILDHGPDLGVQMHQFSLDTPDPVSTLFQYFDSSQAAKNGVNSSHLVDPALDQRIASALAQPDREAAARQALEIQKAAAEQVPVIPLWWGDGQVAVRRGWTYDRVNPYYYQQPWVDEIQRG